MRWSETLAGIARTGLGFTESLYERERFEEVLNVAADIKAAANGAPGLEVRREQDHFVQEWLESVGEGVPGYVTPKVAIGAIVGNDDGELLLVQRADSGIWLYPTGWADVGYSPAEVAVKEVAEETGIECEPVQVLAVIDGQRMGFSRFGMYMLLFHCRRRRRRAAAATRWRPPTSAGSGPTTCRRPRPAPSGGADGVRRDRRRGLPDRRSTASARRSGALRVPVRSLARRCGGRRPGGQLWSRSPRKRSTSATSSSGRALGVDRSRLVVAVVVVVVVVVVSSTIVSRRAT